MNPDRNTLNESQARAKISQETAPRKTLSFYRYTLIQEPKTLRDELFKAWSALGVLGRVYVAKEGINAQISLPESQLPAFREHLESFEMFSGTPLKFAIEEPTLSFWKLTIKVRRQIVADNLPAGSYDMNHVGTHLSAVAFNQAIDQGAIIVDMRNRYESAIGRFEHAITPSSQTFSDELREVATLLSNRKAEKIALYCTGGIRCEKASAYLKQQGFLDVNQLHGGIIHYQHQVKQEEIENKFHGKNFVFDGRMAETVTDEILGTCFTCKQAADRYTNCKNDLCHALFIQCEPCEKNMFGTCSPTCQSIAILPEEERKRLRKNRKATFKILQSPSSPHILEDYELHAH